MTNKMFPVRFQHIILLYEHVDITQNKNIQVFTIRQWLIWNLSVGAHMSVQKLAFELLRLFSLGNWSLLEHSNPIYDELS